MKNKKIIFIGSILFIILLVFVLYLINNKEGSSKIQDDNKLDSKTDTEPVNLLEAVLKKNGKNKILDMVFQNKKSRKYKKARTIKKI